MYPSWESILKRGAEGIARGNEGARFLHHMWCMARGVEAESDHPLLDYSPERLSALQRIDAIVVTGPSGAGKSSIVDVAREWIHHPGFSEARFAIPKRIVSRPQRDNDNVDENDFATDLQEFSLKVGDGIRWKRKMDLEKTGGRIEWYGFEAAPSGTIPIYSANLDFFSSESELSGIPEDFFDRTLVLYVYALPHIREKRLHDRSPDIIAERPEEAAKRLSGDTESVLKKAHIRIRTRSFESERTIAGEVMLLIMLLIAERRTEAKT